MERGRLDHLPEFLTRAQVAALAQVSMRTVDRHIRAGRLVAHKTNGHVRIRRRDVAHWLTGLAVLLLLILALIAGCTHHHRFDRDARFDAQQEAVLDRHEVAVRSK